jgi:hypothetical protein
VDKIADVSIFDAANVIEFKDFGIGYLAIYARMVRKIFPNKVA